MARYTKIIINAKGIKNRETLADIMTKSNESSVILLSGERNPNRSGSKHTTFAKSAEITDDITFKTSKHIISTR